MILCERKEVETHDYKRKQPLGKKANSLSALAGQAIALSKTGYSSVLNLLEDHAKAKSVKLRPFILYEEVI